VDLKAQERQRELDRQREEERKKKEIAKKKRDVITALSELGFEVDVNPPNEGKTLIEGSQS
ncbi:MAG: hypothetical protein AAB646_00620, partial [Patescibacteria group bacterium]